MNQNPNYLPPELTPDDVARRLGVELSTLRVWRYRRQGPPWYKLNGSGGVRYDPALFEAWLAEQKAQVVA